MKTRYVYTVELGRDGFRCVVVNTTLLKKARSVFEAKKEELKNGILFLSRWVDGEPDNCADLESVRLPEA